MSKLLAKIFPLSHIRNIAIFYILSAVYNAWFMAAIWIFMWGMFMTKTQIGISDSFTFAIGFLFELPSGVLADIMGRRKAIILGNTLLAVGNLFIGLSSSFLSITLWYLVWTIGYAFQSGATEALAYDSVKQRGLTSKWNQVIGTSTVIGKITYLISASVGGLLYVLNFRLPNIAAAGIGVVGIIAAFYLKEIKVKIVENWSAKIYITQIKEGVGVLLQPRIARITIISLTILSVGYMYNWGILRPLTAERFGYTPTTYAYLISLIALAVVASMSILKTTQKLLSIKNHILLITLIYAALFLITGFSHSWIVGGLLMISLAVALTHSEILFSQFINEHTESKHRATTLSAVALFTKLPYILLAIIVARIAENNVLPQFMITVGSVSLIVWLVSFVKERMYDRTHS